MQRIFPFMINKSDLLKEFNIPRFYSICRSRLFHRSVKTTAASFLGVEVHVKSILKREKKTKQKHLFFNLRRSILKNFNGIMSEITIFNLCINLMQNEQRRAISTVNPYNYLRL